MVFCTEGVVAFIELGGRVFRRGVLYRGGGVLHRGGNESAFYPPDQRTSLAML